MTQAKRYQQILHNVEQTELALQLIGEGEVKATPEDIEFLQGIYQRYTDELNAIVEEELEIAPNPYN